MFFYCEAKVGLKYLVPGLASFVKSGEFNSAYLSLATGGKGCFLNGPECTAAFSIYISSSSLEVSSKCPSAE